VAYSLPRESDVQRLEALYDRTKAFIMDVSESPMRRLCSCTADAAVCLGLHRG
jgi:hypothetical protein